MSRLAVLRDLAEYSSGSNAGGEAFKSCLWQLTILRRKQNRGMLTMEETFHADQIREELRARTMVRDRAEPTLIADEDNDDDNNNNPSPTPTTPEWEKLSVLEARAVANKENTVHAATTTASSLSTGGLRQRVKTGTHEPDQDKKMMVQDPMMDEEEMLLQRDPLDLFTGVRPGDLKVAQKMAEEALDFYIQAANQAAKILEQLNATTKKGPTKI